MTTGTFKFQIDQGVQQTIVISGLGYTQQVKLEQNDKAIFLHIDNIDSMIETLRACKKWLNLP